MASLLSPRRLGAEVSLRATAAHEPRPSDPDGIPPTPPIPWWLAAVLGGVLAAAAAWILCAGLAALGWVSAEPGTLAGALALGTRVWLAGNGVGVTLGTIPVTVVPWGLTALSAFLLHRVSTLSARLVRPGTPTGPVALAVATTGSYAVPVLVGAVWLGQPWLAPGHWAAVLATLLAVSWWSACRVLGYPAILPRWVARAAVAVLAAQLVMLVCGSAVLVTGLAVHRDRVMALQEALDPGITGAIALWFAQLVVVPDAIVWAGAYALGAGFRLGDGSLVAPAATELGLLPGVPLLGALPTSGPGGTDQLCWLAAGALAGAVAAWLVLRGRGTADDRRPRADLASLIGGAAGVAAGLAFAGLAWAVSGDLGVDRLAGLGPRLLPLVVMGCTTMGLAGLVTGLLLGLTRRRVPRSETA